MLTTAGAPVTHIIQQLFDVIAARKNADAGKSYVASLYQKGTAHISGKVMEEAQEAVEEALKGDQDRLRAESADLLFHLMVLWADQGITPDEVFKVLEQRQGVSGHQEKASREG